ncbi:MAG: hypothetical protein JW844_06635 [Candidatus Omnitrophica bacterium]|nr:hypothetical protein [Candidatus Omnitrophota bacterium]
MEQDLDRKRSNDGKNGTHRVVALLNRAQVDFLDRIGKDALFSTGSKLARTEIIAAMINVLRRLEIRGDDVSSTEELERRIVEAIKKMKENT